MDSTTGRKPPQLPPVFATTAITILADAERILKGWRAFLNKIVNGIEAEAATYNTVILPLAQEEDRVSLEIGVITFYQYVSSDPAIRKASVEAEKTLENFRIETAGRSDLFQLIHAVVMRKENLDHEDERLLNNFYLHYVRMGMNIETESIRDDLKKIRENLSGLSIRAEENYSAKESGLWFTLEELDGVPEDVIESFKEGENHARFMTFSYPDLGPTLRYAKNQNTRKRAYIGNVNKCNDNIPLFENIVALRAKAAKMLGYPHHVASRVENYLFNDCGKIENFLATLRCGSAGGGLKELENLKELKSLDLKARALEDQDDGNYYVWDHDFYETLMLEKDFEVDHEQISEYFPLEPTIHGMLQIFEHAFDMVFCDIENDDRQALSQTGRGEDIVWHPDVKVFSVWNSEEQENGFLGYLYLDLHPREGKYNHSANFSIQPGFTFGHGERRHAVTSLICNFSKPSPKKPSLLKHREVVTLFHELGHGIHDLVSLTKFSEFHGTAVPWDSVEIASRLLENWCWDKTILFSLSIHYSYLSESFRAAWVESSSSPRQPPEKLPAETAESIVNTRYCNHALETLVQIHISTFDVQVHKGGSSAKSTSSSISRMYNEQRRDLTGICGPETLGEDHEQGLAPVISTHLVTGYDATYYAYLVATTFGKTIFQKFFQGNPMNKVKSLEWRKNVLEKGGSQDPERMFKALLGDDYPF